MASRRAFCQQASAVVLAGSVAGCTSLQGSGSDFALPDEASFGVASPVLVAHNLPIFPYFADRMAENDVEFSKKGFNGYTPMAGALLKNEITFGGMGISAIIQFRNQNLPIKVPLGFTRRIPFTLVINPEIDGWSGLQGKTWAPTSRGRVSG